MANNIDIHYKVVEETVIKAKSILSENQSNCNSVYQAIANMFVDSSGETADAIRELQTAEQLLANEFSNTLTKLYDCIQFTANEFAAFDAKMNTTMATGGLHTGGRNRRKG